MKNIDLNKIPHDLLKIIELFNEFILQEEVSFKRLYEYENVKLIRSKDLLKYLPEIIWFRHGFGLVKLDEEIYIIENPNIFIKDIKDLYERNIPLIMIRLCLNKLYDPYYFLMIIDAFRRRLYKYYDYEYAEKILRELRTVLKKTEISRGVLCR
jgi:hypothetical protein